MRCLSCQYDLNNLAEHRCPECGRAFDPNNPRSFDSGKSPAWSTQKDLAVLAAVAFAVAFAMSVLFWFGGGAGGVGGGRVNLLAITVIIPVVIAAGVLPLVFGLYFLLFKRR